MATNKQRRGLAAMSPERRKLIAQRGQQKLRQSGKAHAYTPDTGRAARATQLEQKERDTNGHNA